MQITVKQPSIPLAASPEHLSLVHAADPDFKMHWNEFLKALPLYSFRYQIPVREYYMMLSGSGAQDLSFIVKSIDGPLAICSLYVEKIDGAMQASYSNGGFLPVPLFHPKLGPKQLRALEAMVFEQAMAKLKQHSATRWLVEADVLSVGTDELEDQLPARFGMLDISLQSHIMDLTGPREDLWLQLRHSAKSIINRGFKTYEFSVYDETNFTFEVGERHRLLHHKCSGRVTRPLETFHKMNSWIKDGCGLMFEQRHKDAVVQMILVALGKNTAYGASAADDPDFHPEVPLTHPMNFFIYEEVKKRGILYYDVGETTFRDTIYRIRTPKEKSICDFKRAFGRQSIPLKRWIWFESAKEELSFLEAQFAKYKQHVQY